MTTAPLELTLPRDLSAPRMARHALDEWFGKSIADDGSDTAELLVSELVTNAVLHGQGTITVRAHLDDDRLLVEVMDEGTGFERTLRDADFEKGGGWGLSLVDSESSRWGVLEGTTHVWFELARPGPRIGQEFKPASGTAALGRATPTRVPLRRSRRRPARGCRR